MKKCLFAGALSICILLLSGCSLITKQANAKLTPILFDSPNSTYSCTIDGQQYFSTSGNTNDKNLEKNLQSIMKMMNSEMKHIRLKDMITRILF